MERTLISVSFPNFITVNLMAAAGFVLFVLIAHAFKMYGPQQAASNTGGY